MKVLKYVIYKVTEISLFAINGRKKTGQIHWPGIPFSYRCNQSIISFPVPGDGLVLLKGMDVSLVAF